MTDNLTDNASGAGGVPELDTYSSLRIGFLAPTGLISLVKAGGVQYEGTELGLCCGRFLCLTLPG